MWGLDGGWGQGWEGSIPGQGTKIAHDSKDDQKRKINK